MILTLVCWIQSTLASVICRVIANESPTLQLTLNGVSIYSIPLTTYRKNDVNLFPQDSFLFSGTVRDAVDPYHLYSNETILLQLQRFSNALITEKNFDSSPNNSFHLMNLNFQITSNGGNISAGEKQILVLVRASLSKAKIVILDEITSHMTIQTADTAVKMLRFCSSHFDLLSTMSSLFVCLLLPGLIWWRRTTPPSF